MKFDMYLLYGNIFTQIIVETHSTRVIILIIGTTYIISTKHNLWTKFAWMAKLLSGQVALIMDAYIMYNSYLI
jgi:hypothetical protein